MATRHAAVARWPTHSAARRRSAACSRLRHELVDEARSAGVQPKDDAAEQMMVLVDAMTTGEDLSPDVDDLRFDLAVAAALVYVGRIGSG